MPMVRVNSPKKIAKQKRNTEIVTLTLKGHTPSELGEKYGMSTSNVCCILKKAREDYHAARLTNIEKLISQEVAKLEVVEAEYWRAWERSIGQHTKVKRKTNRLNTSETVVEETGEQFEQPLEETVDTEELAGNPAFLQGVERCIEKRMKLLGLVSKEDPDKYSEVNINAISVHYVSAGAK